jgi:signal transduction histidine kinase
MYSSYLMDELSGRLSNEEMECLSIIRSSSTYMLDLVSDLLDIATIESGKLQLQIDEGDIRELVLHVIKLNRGPASRKKLDIQLHEGDDIPPVRCDRRRLEQVIHNLLHNAVKFSYPESSIMVRLHRKGDEILLSVEDRGTGIAEEEKKNLFNMFEHARTRGTEGEKSTGLGLAIAQKIVLAHGGNIWAESEVGRGTTLFVTLPIAGL